MRLKNYVRIGHYDIHARLFQFVNDNVLSEAERPTFWAGLEQLLDRMIHPNELLLRRREQYEQMIQEWYSAQTEPFDVERYEAFLTQIGYIEPPLAPVTIDVTGVDDEIKSQAGPQLVVPLDNARYVLNAVNARWGSLYDALYGTDVIGTEDGKAPGTSYNPLRGQAVIEFAKQFLDDTFPLSGASHRDAIRYVIKQRTVYVVTPQAEVAMARESVVGYTGTAEAPERILLTHHGLRVELQFDRDHPIGQIDSAGMKDVILESALSVIVDCEDSVAAVCAEEKVRLYENWLRLMDGSLEATFVKDGRTLRRTLNQDRDVTSLDGERVSVPGRALLMIRNVGHLMQSDLMLDAAGREVPEGILDAVFTALIASRHLEGTRHSREGSIYIVKPKMHGSEEVAFTNHLFEQVEALVGLPRHTLKVGVMDEERRTSLNLGNCIAQVRERIVFINTGFLDRTGDEIHTSLTFGPMRRKQEMKHAPWLHAYEQLNVMNGLAAGFSTRAQIGKGMWAMPDRMKAMLEEKHVHVRSGATTAWVPSPTAATLHALHYHQIDAFAEQRSHLNQPSDITAIRRRLLDVPLATTIYSKEDVTAELENNLQGLLGYVVRWVEQGIGCSKVPDLQQVGLMEDRATLRISSQHVANWLYHGIVSQAELDTILYRMAAVVDAQNAHDAAYTPMTPEVDRSIAYQAARELIMNGLTSPNGYTEPILHARRRDYLARTALYSKGGTER